MEGTYWNYKCDMCKCMLLFICVRKVIVNGIIELQIAPIVVSELLQQLSHQDTYRCCCEFEILFLKSKIPPSPPRSVCGGCTSAYFIFPLYKTLHQVQLVKSIWIDAAAPHLLLCLLKQCSNTINTITAIILTLVVRETLASVGQFRGVASLSREGETLITFSFLSVWGKTRMIYWNSKMKHQVNK